MRQKVRIGVALALYSFSFSLSCGIALFSGEGVIGAFTVEPAAMIVLGVICAAFFKFDRQPDRPYKLYRAVAPLIGAGFLLMAVSPLPDEVGGFCVALGYVLFELLVLNDCCNIVKANDASLLRVMAAAGWPLRWECSWAGWRRLPRPPWRVRRKACRAWWPSAVRGSGFRLAGVHRA